MVRGESRRAPLSSSRAPPLGAAWSVVCRPLAHVRAHWGGRASTRLLSILILRTLDCLGSSFARGRSDEALLPPTRAPLTPHHRCAEKNTPPQSHLLLRARRPSFYPVSRVPCATLTPARCMLSAMPWAQRRPTRPGGAMHDPRGPPQRPRAITSDLYLAVAKAKSSDDGEMADGTWPSKLWTPPLPVPPCGRTRERPLQSPSVIARDPG